VMISCIRDVGSLMTHHQSGRSDPKYLKVGGIMKSTGQ